MQVTIELPDTAVHQFYNCVPATERDSFLSSAVMKELAVLFANRLMQSKKQTEMDYQLDPAIRQKVEDSYGMVTVDTTGQDFDLMNFKVGEHVTLFDEE